MKIFMRYLQMLERHDVDRSFRVFERAFAIHLNESLIAFESDDSVNLNSRYL